MEDVLTRQSSPYVLQYFSSPWGLLELHVSSLGFHDSASGARPCSAEDAQNPHGLTGLEAIPEDLQNYYYYLLKNPKLKNK